MKTPNPEPRVSIPRAYLGTPVDEVEAAAFLFPEMGDDVDCVDVSEVVEYIELRESP